MTAALARLLVDGGEIRLSSREISDATIEKAALAIMALEGCGLIVEGVTVLCCDPRAKYIEERDQCSCWAAACAALEAAPLSSREISEAMVKAAARAACEATKGPGCSFPKCFCEEAARRAIVPALEAAKAAREG